MNTLVKSNGHSTDALTVRAVQIGAMQAGAMQAGAMPVRAVHELPLHTPTQLIVFRLQQGEYALPVESITEVLRMVALTPVPQGAPWLQGMLNLRGQVLPVIDLRTRLELPRLAVTLTTPIIVVAVQGRALGLIADTMVEVLTAIVEPVEAARMLIGPTHPVAGLARAGDRLILVLDLERLTSDIA